MTPVKPDLPKDVIHFGEQVSLPKTSSLPLK